MKRRLCLALVLAVTPVLTVLFGGVSFASIPLEVNHQGKVEVNGTPFDGNGDFRFALVDPDTGNNVWTNDGTGVGGTTTPTAAVNLPVIHGIYNVRLGDTGMANMVAIPSTLFDDDNIVLRIWFDDGVNGNQRLAPDHTLTSAPYAFHALTADTATHADTATTATAVLASPVPHGVIAMWSGSIASIPAGWVLCDGTNGTPDLRNRFVIAAKEDQGGIAETDVTGSWTQTGGVVSHNHTLSGSTGSDTSGNYRGWNAAPGDSGWNGDASRGWHTHAFSGTSGESQHLPPYFALAFIMKI